MRSLLLIIVEESHPYSRQPFMSNLLKSDFIGEE